MKGDEEKARRPAAITTSPKPTALRHLHAIRDVVGKRRLGSSCPRYGSAFDRSPCGARFRVASTSAAAPCPPTCPAASAVLRIADPAMQLADAAGLAALKLK